MKSFFVLVFMSLVIAGYSEVIILNSGSVISGKIIKMDEDTMTILSDFGEFVVDRDQIKKFFYTQEEYDADKRKELDAEKTKVEVVKKDEELKKKAEEEERLKAEILVKEKEVEIAKKNILTLTSGNKAGIGLLSAGGVLLLIGAGIFVFDNVYYTDLKTKATTYAEFTQINNQDIAFFASSIATMGLGAIFMIVGIPMSVYKPKKKAAGLHYEIETAFNNGVYLGFKINW